MVENPPVNAGDIREAGLISGSGRSPGGGHRNPLQCPCLENPMDRGALQATVHGVAKSQTRLSDYLSTLTFTLSLPQCARSLTRGPHSNLQVNLTFQFERGSYYIVINFNTVSTSITDQ